MYHSCHPSQSRTSFGFQNSGLSRGEELTSAERQRSLHDCRRSLSRRESCIIRRESSTVPCRFQRCNGVQGMILLGVRSRLCTTINRNLAKSARGHLTESDLFAESSWDPSNQVALQIAKPNSQQHITSRSVSDPNTRGLLLRQFPLMSS